MQETTNFKLKKQELTDKADITQISENWDIIDTKLHEKFDAAGGTISGNVTVNGQIIGKDSLLGVVDVTKGTNPDSEKSWHLGVYDSTGFDIPSDRLARIQYTALTDGSAQLAMMVDKYGDTSSESEDANGIIMQYAADGTGKVSLTHNPAATSNDKQVATTYWVNNKIATPSEFGFVKLADENAFIQATDQNSTIALPLIYKINDFRRPSTNYALNDCVACPFKYDVFLECTKAGETSSEALDTREVTYGKVITDGTAQWTVRSHVKKVNNGIADANGNVTVEIPEVDLSNCAKLNAANTFSSTNTFNSTCKFASTVTISKTPTATTDAANKAYVDSKGIDLDTLKNMLLEINYPVGSIYMSVKNVSPQSFLGGTWEAMDDGRVLIGANSTYPAGSTGGEATHKLTTNEMPSHNHGGSTSSAGSHYHGVGTLNVTGELEAGPNNQGFASGAFYYERQGGSTIGGNVDRMDIVGFDASDGFTGSTSSAGSHSHSVTINSTGGNIAHNNMPPYLAVYMWKRTA